MAKGQGSLPPTTCADKEATSHCQCYCLVQETFVICLSINGFMCCSLVGKEGAREEGGKAGPRE